MVERNRALLKLRTNDLTVMERKSLALVGVHALFDDTMGLQRGDRRKM